MKRTWGSSGVKIPREFGFYFLRIGSVVLKVWNTFSHILSSILTWCKFGLNWLSKLQENNERINTLVAQICGLSDVY